MTLENQLLTKLLFDKNQEKLDIEWAMRQKFDNIVDSSTGSLVYTAPHHITPYPNDLENLLPTNKLRQCEDVGMKTDEIISHHLKNLRHNTISFTNSLGEPIQKPLKYWLEDFVDIVEEYGENLYGMIIFKDNLRFNIGHPLHALFLIEIFKGYEHLHFKALIYEDLLFKPNIAEASTELKERLDLLMYAYLTKEETLLEAHKEIERTSYKPITSPILSYTGNNVPVSLEILELKDIFASNNPPKQLTSKVWHIPTPFVYLNNFIPHYGVTLCYLSNQSDRTIYSGENLTPFYSVNRSHEKNLCTGANEKGTHEILARLKDSNMHSKYHSILYGIEAPEWKNLCLKTSARLYKEEILKKENND